MSVVDGAAVCDCAEANETSTVFVEVPDARCHRDKIASAALSFIVLALTTCSHWSVWSAGRTINSLENLFANGSLDLVFSLLEFVSTVVFAQFVAEFLRRLCLLSEEMCHVRTRYEHSRRAAVATTLQLDVQFGVYLLTSVVFLATCALWNWAIERHLLRYFFIVPVYTLVQLVWHTMGYKVSLKSDDEINSGKAFACQYYHGYLKIILPSLMERMQNYESKHSVKLATHRLLLLAPESCYVQPTLDCQSEDMEIIELCQEMEPVIQDHCGSSSRVYKNPVYQIWKRGFNVVHVAMEGIAILSNIHEMNLNKESTGLSDERLLQQSRLFCTALQGILDKSCYSNLVEIVFYKDEDESGRKVKMSDIVLDKLERLDRN